MTAPPETPPDPDSRTESRQRQNPVPEATAAAAELRRKLIWAGIVVILGGVAMAVQDGPLGPDAGWKGAVVALAGVGLVIAGWRS